MPIQLTIWERRDNGNREVMGKTALELCRIFRKSDGVTSSRYYWTGDGVAFLTEGEATALDTISPEAQQDYSRAAFVLMDNARPTLNIRLQEARDALKMRDAGR